MLPWPDNACNYVVYLGLKGGSISLLWGLCMYSRLKNLEHGCSTTCAGFPSFCGLGLEDGHVPIFWLLLYYKDTWTLWVVRARLLPWRPNSRPWSVFMSTSRSETQAHKFVI